MPANDATAPRLLTVGLAQNSTRTEWNLPEVEASVRAVASAVAPYGFKHEDWSAPGTTAALRDRLVGLADLSADIGSAPALLYWCGHGQLTDRDFFLITNDAKSASALGGAFSARDLGQILWEEEKRRLAGPDPGWRIVIVDTCDSGIGIAEMAEAFPDSSPRGTLLIASAAQGAAGAGDFGSRLASVFTGEFINQTSPIRLLELKRRIEDWLGDSNLIRGTLDWSATIPAPTSAVATISTSMDLLAELRSLPEETLAHFLPRLDDGTAEGRAVEVTSLPWQFVGRMPERTRVARWLDSDDAMLAVVGVAGSGKSAMLGMVLASTLPDLVEELRRRNPAAWPPEVTPRDARFQAVCQLAGKTVVDLAHTLVAAFDLQPAGTIDGVIAQLRNACTAPTVLADALDEALDPAAMAAALQSLAALPGAKILVGTRRTPGTAGDEAPDVVMSLGDPPVCEIGVDTDAAETFVTDQLGADMPEEHAQAWASEVAAKEQPFLFARLAVHEALANPSEDPRGALAHGQDGLFAQAWRRLSAANPHTGALLHALALARGRGFPRNDGIWALAASALIGEQVLDPDVGLALNEAAPYILVDHEFGQSSFRLTNQAFVDFFRTEPSNPLDERAVAWVLLREARRATPVPEYLRTYLPEHLSASHAWDRTRLADLARLAPTPLGSAIARDVVDTPNLSPLLSLALTTAKAHPDATAEEWPRLLKAARRRAPSSTPRPEGET